MPEYKVFKYIGILVFVIAIAVASIIYLESNVIESHSEITNGSWAEYDVTFISTNDTIIQTSRFKLWIIEIQERTITFNVINLLDESKEDQREVSGVIGKDDLGGFIIPSNLDINDIVVMGVYNFTIKGIEEKVVCKEKRQIVFADIPFFEGLSAFWDKETGIIIEGTREVDQTITNIKMEKTNIW